MRQLIEGTSRLSRRVKLWAVAVFVVVAALASFSIWGRSTPLPYRVRAASVVGDVLVGPDNRTITLNTSWGGCDYRPDLVVHETTDQVTLTLQRKDFSGPGVGCEDGGAGRIATTLANSLGSRPMIDGVTGKPVIFFDGRGLVKPGYLPSEYREDIGPIRYLFGLSAAPVKFPYWVRAFQSGSTGVHSELLITQILGDAGPVVSQDQATVQGHPAAFVDDMRGAQPAARTLSWSDGKYRFEVSASMPRSLSDQEMIKIADGLVAAG